MTTRRRRRFTTDCKKLQRASKAAGQSTNGRRLANSAASKYHVRFDSNSRVANL